MDAVVIGLELEPVASASVAVPTANEVMARNILLRASGLVEASAEDVALQRDGIALTRCPVEPEPAAKPVPTIVCRSTARQQRRLLT